VEYKDAGVDHDSMDRCKRAAQLAGRETTKNLARHGFTEIEWTRGESVYVVRRGGLYIGFVIEGLGTKDIVAYRTREQARITKSMLSGFSGLNFQAMGIDSAAMVFNDMATLGIRPVVFGQHFAAGSSDIFEDEERWQGYIEGTVQACNHAGCSWGCGETPTLKGVIEPEAVELSGAS
jgi:phosphoribosylformylglycinamidine cyclo-ligase